MSEVRRSWHSSDKYEYFMGRWSRQLGNIFIDWLNPPQQLNWLDVGCGTGALCQTILTRTNPKSLFGIDISIDFVTPAHQAVANARLFVSDAENLPFQSDKFDMIASGLTINFAPKPQQAIYEMRRVLKPEGVANVYVWDYTGKMEMLRYFWNAALDVDPSSARTYDEGLRFPICQPEALHDAFEQAGFKQVAVQPLEVPTVFQNFDDYWLPFTVDTFPAPRYAMALSEEKRSQLRELLRERLPVDDDGKICLTARAWVVQGMA